MPGPDRHSSSSMCLSRLMFPLYRAGPLDSDVRYENAPCAGQGRRRMEPIHNLDDFPFFANFSFISYPDQIRSDHISHTTTDRNGSHPERNSCLPFGRFPYLTIPRTNVTRFSLSHLRRFCFPCSDRQTGRPYWLGSIVLERLSYQLGHLYGVLSGFPV